MGEMDLFVKNRQNIVCSNSSSGKHMFLGDDAASFTDSPYSGIVGFATFHVLLNAAYCGSQKAAVPISGPKKCCVLKMLFIVKNCTS